MIKFHNFYGGNMRSVSVFIGLVLIGLTGLGCSSGDVEPVEPVEPAEVEAPPHAALADSLTFHASFDAGTDADFGSGDRTIYSAPSYDERDDQSTPGISMEAEIVTGAGRFGDALRFNETNKQALFYRATDNVAYSTSNMSGTVSFWLNVDPAVEIEPVYCDPIQITDVDFNDAGLWVDFTNENPKQFRLGIFGDLEVWNPDDIAINDNPDFLNRLIPVDDPPFASGQWTHVAFTYSGLNSADGATIHFYLNGENQGAREGIAESFTWDVERAVIKLGINYAGLFDEVAIFDRALSDSEIAELYGLDMGASALHE